MTARPFFSIIVPVIRGRYLAQAIQSVLDQSFCDFELIVINDASADPIQNILAPFRDDRRLHYITNSVNRGNKSPAIVWNQGLEIARGRFTMVLGDDDYYGAGVLESLHAMAIGNPLVALFRVRLALVDANNVIIGSSGRLPEWEPWWDLLHARCVLGRPQSICEHAFSTDWLRKKGQFWELPKAWGSDDAGVLSLSTVGGCVSDNNCFAYWRNDGANLSSLYNPEYFDSIVELIEWQKEIVIKSDIPEYMPKSILLKALEERKKAAYYFYKADRNSNHIFLNYLKSAFVALTRSRIA